MNCFNHRVCDCLIRVLIWISFFFMILLIGILTIVISNSWLRYFTFPLVGTNIIWISDLSAFFPFSLIWHSQINVIWIYYFFSKFLNFFPTTTLSTIHIRFPPSGYKNIEPIKVDATFAFNLAYNMISSFLLWEIIVYFGFERVVK